MEKLRETANYDLLINNHNQAIELLEIIKDYSNRVKSSKEWIRKHGHQFWGLVPKQKRQIKAYERFVERMKNKYINLITNKN